MFILIGKKWHKKTENGIDGMISDLRKGYVPLKWDEKLNNIPTQTTTAVNCSQVFCFNFAAAL